MGHAPPLVAAQHPHIGQSLTTVRRVQQYIGQHGGIQKAQIHALPGQRVNGVRRITDQRQAFGYVAFGMALAQRHAHSRVGTEHRAQAAFKGKFQFAAKPLVVQRHQRLRLFRGGRPDD